MADERLQWVSASLAVAVGLLALGLAPALAGTAASTGWRIVKVVGVMREEENRHVSGNWFGVSARRTPRLRATDARV